MSKLLLIAIVTILTIVAIFLFSGIKKTAKFCKSNNEIECKTRLVCKPFYEYGLHCGEDGCKEGERFKECSPRF